MTSFADLRARMVSEQLAARGIADPRVLEAMGAVPRERFLPEPLRARAYDDAALGIDAGQTISQPWIVAAICDALALEPGERLLEVGTGSGYSAAVFCRLGARVLSIERLPGLARAAQDVLAGLGVEGVEVRVGDGSLGAPEEAPFDAIAVHAAAPSAPSALLGQLALGGRMVIPLAAGSGEELTRLRREPGSDPASPETFVRTALSPCRFVRLIGAQGYADRQP